MLLMPFQAFFFAINPDGQVVFFADGNLTGVKDTPGAVVKTQQNVAVVIQPTALDKNRQVSTHLGYLQPRNIFREILCVRPDVTHTSCAAALLRVGPPGGLHLACLLKGRGQPALRIPHYYLANLT